MRWRRRPSPISPCERSRACRSPFPPPPASPGRLPEGCWCENQTAPRGRPAPDRDDRSGRTPSRMARRRLSGRAGLALDLETLVEIAGDRLHQRLNLAVKEMVGARDHLLLDHDAFLGLQLIDQAGDVLVRHHGILVAMDDHARGRAGGEKRKIVEVGGWSDRDEAL